MVTMPFIDRHVERARLDAFSRDVSGGGVERHLALVGPRRIGKSRILDDFLSGTAMPGAPIAVARLAMDGASATLRTYLIEMIRAVVAAYSRRAGRPEIGPAATTDELAAEAAVVDPGLATAIARALRLYRTARPDGHQVFMAATTLPEEAARATGIPVIVLADEFQHLLDVASYAPFRAGRGGPASKAARENVLKAFRTAVERKPGVGWVVTGSSIRLMGEILGAGSLMGRFDVLEVKAFGPQETRQLARAIWDEQGIDFEEEAADRVDVLTLGHPFYADVVCRQVAFETLKLGSRRAGPELVDRALLESLHNPSGGIWIACQEIWDSLVARTAPALRGMVSELAQRGEATVGDLAAGIGLASEPAAWPLARKLERIGLVVRDNTRISLVDPVFRYWLVTAWNPGVQPPDIADPAVAGRAIKNYQEAYLAQRSDRGRLVEAYVRDLVRNFAGQLLDGRRFGRPGVRVSVPTVDDVRRVAVQDAAGEVFGHPAEIELDLCFGTERTWLAEVRDRTKRPTATDIDLLVRKAEVVRRLLGLGPGEAWFISFSGFGRDARLRASELGVLVSGERDLQAIAATTGVRRA